MNMHHSLAVLAAFAVLPQLALAEQDVAYNAQADNAAYKPTTCAEAREAAWLLRQMERTDGDVSPQVPAPFECETDRAKMLAATDEAY